MKRQWAVHRQLVEVPEAQRRWDRVYPLLLAWGGALPQQGEAPGGGSQEEADHANRDLRACLDPAASPGADD